MSVEITELVSRLVIFLVVLLLSISIHEAGHAWMSWKWGDDTAYMLGRVTLNPVAHIDVVGTLILPILGFLSAASGGLALLGWGKACPVNPRKWTDYKKGNFWVSIAGVLGNLILVIVALISMKIIILSGYLQLGDFDSSNPIAMFLKSLLLMNISLFIFNLLPFPPLDGSKILSTFLPESFQPILNFLDQFGMYVLFFLVMMGFTRVIMNPIMDKVMDGVRFILNL
jgi:Zn-dependent protease